MNDRRHSFRQRWRARAYAVAALGLLLPSSGIAGTGATPSAASDSEIHRMLVTRVDIQKRATGIVLGIVGPNGKRVIAYGTTALGDKRPVDGNTVFDIGSITKVFTALLLCDMAQRGEVALDDPVSKYLPANLRLPAPNGIEAIIRRAVHEVDSQQFVTPLTQLLGRTLSQSRFNTALIGAFAAVAILLAAVGIFGVMAYNVTQRTKEIGIRMALGAQKRQMLTMALRQSLTMAAIGIVIGLAGAFAATRLLPALLYGVGSTDLPTYLSVALLLAGAALLAGLIPARRAMKVDQMVALRYE